MKHYYAMFHLVMFGHPAKDIKLSKRIATARTPQIAHRIAEALEAARPISKEPTKAHGSDLCKCGDYRSQHGQAGCVVCVDAAPGYGGCKLFRFVRRATVEELKHWTLHHGQRRQARRRIHGAGATH